MHHSWSTTSLPVSVVMVTMAVVMMLVTMTTVRGDHDAKRLFDDLLKPGKYNKLVRPVAKFNESLMVTISVKLAQIVDIDEKNQIIETNMWLKQEWLDNNLKWDPSEYDGISEIYVPAEDIWVPDIVLYNNADGYYNVTMLTKATVTSAGQVTWNPPAVWKSYCALSVMYFPFDEQNCYLKFGMWTYHGALVDMRHKTGGNVQNKTILDAIDVRSSQAHVEWSIMNATAMYTLQSYECCPEFYVDITFTLTLRRKFLFYIINLIIPCVCVNFATITNFYVPSESTEKIILCISILINLAVFQVLLIELVPPNSVTTPLLGEYLLFTFIVVSISVSTQVIVLNIDFRTCSNYTMSSYTRTLFLDILPKVLFMKKPDEEDGGDEEVDWSQAHHELLQHANPYSKRPRRSGPGPLGGDSLQHLVLEGDSETEAQRAFWREIREHRMRSALQSHRLGDTGSVASISVSQLDISRLCQHCVDRQQPCLAHLRSPFSTPNAMKGMQGIAFIAKHFSEADQATRVRDDWKFVSLVIDRLLLWVYSAACLVGTIVILINAPVLYDNQKPLK